MLRITINADDFGLTKSCTKAISQAFQEQLITDTTMIANGSAFDYAIEEMINCELQDRIGIHFNITEGYPLTEEIKGCATFVNDAGVYIGRINRLKPLSKKERQAVYKEFTAQIERLEQADIHLTHADSHHHIHTAIFIAPIFARVCKEHGIKKVRLHRNIGNISLFKKLVKAEYNRWLHRKGFVTTDYFGLVDDVEKYGLFDNLEIMVHPDYDVNGILVDRIDEIDGNAVGKPMTHLEGKYELKGYKDL